MKKSTFPPNTAVTFGKAFPLDPCQRFSVAGWGEREGAGGRVPGLHVTVSGDAFGGHCRGEGAACTWEVQTMSVAKCPTMRTRPPRPRVMQPRGSVGPGRGIPALCECVSFQECPI